jgi:hypothetical protein
MRTERSVQRQMRTDRSVQSQMRTDRSVCQKTKERRVQRQMRKEGNVYFWKILTTVVLGDDSLTASVEVTTNIVTVTITKSHCIHYSHLEQRL